MVAPQIQLFTRSLPKRPYCMDEKGEGLRIRSTETALGKPHIQHNHPNSKLWLVYDIDRPTSPDELTDDLGMPAPNLFVQNRDNGHAHVYFSLDVPVHLNPESSQKAIRFAGAVDCGLSMAMRADAGYSGFISKNPIHPKWRTVSCNPMPYSLGELSDYVDLSSFNDRRRNLPDIGLGRNCTLFDRTRSWAYRARLEYGDFPGWQNAVLGYAMAHNDFVTPLPISEVRATAKSIARWTWKKITEDAFSRIQSHRGKRSGVARKDQVRFKRERAIALIAEGKTQRHVAQVMGVSERQVRNWLTTG